MNLEDERKLKFDRRLVGHTDWIDEAELAAELERLPDASGKIYDPAEDDAGSGASDDSAASGASAATPPGIPPGPSSLS